MSENKDELKIVMEEIEEKTTKKVLELMNSDQVMTANPLYCRGLPLVAEEKESINIAMERLTDIMKEGGDEFKKKTGRNMTYSEMRAMMG
jgi:hypothetical protein